MKGAGRIFFSVLFGWQCHIQETAVSYTVSYTRILGQDSDSSFLLWTKLFSWNRGRTEEAAMSLIFLIENWILKNPPAVILQSFLRQKYYIRAHHQPYNQKYRGKRKKGSDHACSTHQELVQLWWHWCGVGALGLPLWPQCPFAHQWITSEKTIFLDPLFPI